MADERHDYDLLSSYCMRCGAGYCDVMDGNRDRVCAPPANLVAISVRVRSRRMRQLLQRGLS